MFKKTKVILHYLTPKQCLTCLAGKLANKELGLLTKWIVSLFIKLYKVDMNEAEFSDPASYKTFNDFFSRKLKADARPILKNERTLVFPADGVISQFGEITDGKLIQAKSFDYSLDALLICNSALVKMFTNGTFATTYLSPKDYHRVHMPCDATLSEMIYVPGSLYSVNQTTTEHIPNIFARNERLICIFNTEFGPMAQILVGATIVGSIDTMWAGTVTPPREGIVKRWTYPVDGSNAVKLAKGDEMGGFKLGSTVINLFSSGSVSLNPQIQHHFITHVGGHFADQL